MDLEEFLITKNRRGYFMVDFKLKRDYGMVYMSTKQFMDLALLEGLIGYRYYDMDNVVKRALEVVRGR